MRDREVQAGCETKNRERQVRGEKQHFLEKIPVFSAKWDFSTIIWEYCSSDFGCLLLTLGSKNNDIMKKLTIAVLAISLLAISCGKEEVQIDPKPEPKPESAGISVSISAGGFTVAENGTGNEIMAPDFSAGDICGLYVISNGKITGSNIKVTASGSGEELLWTPETVEPLAYDEGNRYFLYYPYQEDSYMEDKIQEIADDISAGQLFAGLVSGWEPSADQSDEGKFHDSDLMIAEGTAGQENDGTVPLSFGMTHSMALAVISTPQLIYDFGEDYPADYTVECSPVFTDRELLEQEGKYYCLVKPESASSIEITFGEDGKKTIGTESITAGTYMTYDVTSTIQCSLQAGDFYCMAEDGKGYVIPQDAASTISNDTQVVGVIFHKGRHDKDDKSDYSKPSVSGGSALGGTVHGYVLALTDAHNGDTDQLKWASKAITKPDDPDYSLNQGTSTDKTDWNGYYNCCRISAFVDEYRQNYHMTDFPAANAAITYGHRAVDGNGQNTDAYDWQARFTAPSDCSGWFLPSAGQLTQIYNDREFLAEQINKVNAVITDTSKEHVRWIKSISNYVWSSTEYQNSPHASAYAVFFNGGDINWQNKYGDSNIYVVRPILVF